MELVNRSVQAISRFDEDGKIIPLRIRLDGEDQQRITANVSEIIFSKECQFAGIMTIDIGCKVEFEDRIQFLLLRYFLADHRWVIAKPIC